MQIRLKFAAAIVCLALPLVVGAREVAKHINARCPVAGSPAKEQFHAKHLGKDVNFCCGICMAEFHKEPQKFDSAVKLSWLESKQIAQVGCPITGRPIDESVKLSVRGAEVGFCCEKCKQKFQEKSDLHSQQAQLFSQFDKSFSLQTTCPLSGKPIDPSRRLEHQGQQVYFCCPGCEIAFKVEPQRYIALLPQFAEPKTTQVATDIKDEATK